MVAETWAMRRRQTRDLTKPTRHFSVSVNRKPRRNIGFRLPLIIASNNNENPAVWYALRRARLIVPNALGRISRSYDPILVHALEFL
jgi:hypothetical protein